MQVDNELFLLRRESTTLEVRPQVVDPTETTALPTALQAGISGDVAPTTLAIVEHVAHQLVVLFR